MNEQQCIEIFERFKAANPAPTTELHYRTPFELLIAVVLSAQSTDVGVNKCTARLFEVANTPQQILALGEEGLIPYIRTLGLYKNKAKNIIGLCRILVDKYQAQVPADRAALESLPGVGRKTANVILNTVFGEPVIAVDTHIFRVANRTGLAPGRTVREVEARLDKIVPAAYKRNAHHWLILHGRYVCQARRPRCEVCIINDLCEYAAKSLMNQTQIKTLASRSRKSSA